jgi:hypothetical protein
MMMASLPVAAMLVLAARCGGANAAVPSPASILQPDTVAADRVWSAAPSPPSLDQFAEDGSEEVHYSGSVYAAPAAGAAAAAIAPSNASSSSSQQQMLRRRAQTAPSVSVSAVGCTGTECSLQFTSDQAGKAWCAATIAGDTSRVNDGAVYQCTVSFRVSRCARAIATVSAAADLVHRPHAAVPCVS